MSSLGLVPVISLPFLYPHPEEPAQQVSRRRFQRALEPPSRQSLRDFLRMRFMS
jgi:hypothetical protein